MPLYDYGCEPCERRQEVFHKMAEDPKVECEGCGGGMRRVITGGNGFILRGFGWAGKNIRVKEDRRRKSERLKRRQLKTWGTPTGATPNVMDKKGEVQTFDTWEKAGKFAETQGYDGRQYKEKAVEVAKRRSKIKSDLAG